MFPLRSIPREAGVSAPSFFLLANGQVLWEDIEEGAPGTSLVKPEVDDHVV